MNVLLKILYISISLMATFGQLLPPTIRRQPESDVIYFKVASNPLLHSPFILHCEANGYPPPKYTWIKDGFLFKHNITLNGSFHDRIVQYDNVGTLQFSRPETSDVGRYQCFAENEYGTASSNSVLVNLTVKEINFTSPKPETVRVKEGDPFSLNCAVPYGNPAPTVVWLIDYLKDGLHKIDDPRTTVDPNGKLWFSNVTRYDSSQNLYYYTCCIHYPLYYEYVVSNRYLIDVMRLESEIPPIEQYVSPEHLVVRHGERLELFCIYGGTPIPQIYWAEFGKPISWENRIQLGNYGKSLIITNVTFTDSKTYECTATNGIGVGKLHSMMVQVISKPIFIVEPQSQTALSGQTVIIQCTVKGSPRPTIEWTWNARIMEHQPPVNRPTVEINRIGDTTVTLRITIEKLEPSHMGKYGCNATNHLGYLYKEVSLRVL